MWCGGYACQRHADMRFKSGDLNQRLRGGRPCASGEDHVPAGTSSPHSWPSPPRPSLLPLGHTPLTVACGKNALDAGTVKRAQFIIGYYHAVPGFA